MSRQVHQFKVIRTDARTLTWWRGKRSLIDMSPTYQRKGQRWSTADKQYLIDSIINGFDVPKFYMADFTWVNSALNEQRRQYAVIDGKQRFEAMFEFLDGNYSLADDFIFLADPDLRIGGLDVSQLKKDHPDIVELVENFNPDVMSVITDNVEYIHELFIRLNRSKPLSGAEVRNATAGKLTKLVRSLREIDFFVSNIRFSTQKGQDLNCAMKLMMFELSGGPVETKKAFMDQFAKDFANDRRVVAAHERVAETLELMAQSFKFRDGLLRSEGQVPVYFWLFRNSSKRSAGYLRQFLEEFQDALRDSRSASWITRPQKQEFIAASRSVNDRGSHVLRFEILSQSFKKWLKLSD